MFITCAQILAASSKDSDNTRNETFSCANVHCQQRESMQRKRHSRSAARETRHVAVLGS